MESVSEVIPGHWFEADDGTENRWDGVAGGLVPRVWTIGLIGPRGKKRCQYMWGDENRIILFVLLCVNIAYSNILD